MWAVGGMPVPAPLDGNEKLLGGGFHGGGDLVVERPIPTDPAFDKRAEVNCVPGEVTGVESPSGSGGEKLSLALRCSQPFKHGEIDLGKLDRALYYGDEIGVNARETLVRAGAELEAAPTLDLGLHLCFFP